MFEALLPWLKSGFGSPSSGHAYGRRASEAIAAARSQVAASLLAGEGRDSETFKRTDVSSYGRRCAVAAKKGDTCVSPFCSVGRVESTPTIVVIALVGEDAALGGVQFGIQRIPLEAADEAIRQIQALQLADLALLVEQLDGFPRRELV